MPLIGTMKSLLSQKRTFPCVLLGFDFKQPVGIVI